MRKGERKSGKEKIFVRVREGEREKSNQFPSVNPSFPSRSSLLLKSITFSDTHTRTCHSLSLSLTLSHSLSLSLTLSLFRTHTALFLPAECEGTMFIWLVFASGPSSSIINIFMRSEKKEIRQEENRQL